MLENTDLSTIKVTNKSNMEGKVASTPPSSGISSAESGNKSIPTRPSVPPKMPLSGMPAVDAVNKSGLEARPILPRPSSSPGASIETPISEWTPPRIPATGTTNKPNMEMKPVPPRPSSSPRTSVETLIPEWTPTEVPTIKASNKPSMEMKLGTAISPISAWTPSEVASKQVGSPVPTWPPTESPFTPQEQGDSFTGLSHALPKHEAAQVREIWERCRQLYLSVFFEEQVHSLGFTSALSGEGKTFLAVATAEILANDTSNPVTLIECNWEHPCFRDYFKLPSTLGLAEWLRGECPASAIRYQITRNLTVIPAGNGRRNAVKLLRQMLQKDVKSALLHSDELLIVDLPSIVSTAYGSLAANLVESLVVVVRAQVTSEALVIEACEQLKHIPVHGIVLNQIKSHIPRWLQQIL